MAGDQELIKPTEITYENPIRVYLEGNTFCALWGKDLQVGEAEFGSTPIEAVTKLSNRILEPDALSQWIKKPL
jgi:hypothetical protein